MKNRIISMLLVVVSCVLLLTGCAFNYQKKDLSEYATFDKAAFAELLKAVEVTEGEFKYEDEDTRNQLVKDEIYNRLVKYVDDEDKITTGTIAEKNLLYYCYYIVATFEEKETVEGTETKVDKSYTFYATNMTASKFQKLALYNLEKDVDKKIMEAFLGEGVPAYDFGTDGAYVTKDASTDVAEAGKVVYVSYKLTVGSKTTEYTNQRITLPAEDDGTFAGYLVGKNIATTLTDKTFGEGETAQKYSGIKINWMVESGKGVEVVFENTVDEEEKPVINNPFTTTTSQKSDDGVTKNLKDAKKVVYHIYPVARQEIGELTEETGKLVFTTLLGDAIAPTSLPSLSKADYKYTEGDKTVTIKSLIEELAEKYKALSDAKSAYDKSPANADLKKKWEDAKAAVADDKLDEYWNKMVKCAEAKEENLSKVLFEEYTESVYDELEAEYNEEIADKVAVAIWKMIQDNVKNVTAPERAVKDAYKHNLESYKYDYYTGNVDGSTASDAKKNIDEYDSFRDYLIAKAAKIAKDELGKTETVDTYDKARDVLEAYAETQVKEYIVIWTAAKAYEIEVVDTEVENFALIQSYYMQIYGMNVTADQIIERYSEENIRTYLAFDKLMAHFLETKADDEDTADVDESDASDYLNITVVRKDAEEKDDK